MWQQNGAIEFLMNWPTFRPSFHAMLHTLHYFAMLPLYAGRSAWISRTTGAPISFVSHAFCVPAFDFKEAAETLRLTISASPTCGNCGSSKGGFQEGQNAIIFCRTGCKDASVFEFVCEMCKAISGPTTVSLRAEGGAPARHVVSAHILEAKFFFAESQTSSAT